MSLTSAIATRNDARHLPQLQSFKLYEPIEPDESGGTSVEFRLTYQGPLSSGGPARDKQALRKHFHSQLRELWKEHPQLKELSRQLYVRVTTPPNLISYPGPNQEQVTAVTEAERF